jgi:hypothetical protein
MRNTPLQPDLQSLIADVTRNLESTKVVSQVWKIEISAPTNTNHLLGAPDLGHPGFVRSHPSDKNKDVARVGHPEFK